MTYALAPHAIPSIPVAGTDLRFPVHRIYCIGRNYADHAAEMGATIDRAQPLFFMKPADAIVINDGDVPYPSATQELHHEIEMVVALSRGGRDIAVASALDHIYAYGVGLDLTRRDLQAIAKKKGTPWDTAKGFDHSAPVSALHRVADVGHPSSQGLSLEVNGERLTARAIIIATTALFAVLAGLVIPTDSRLALTLAAYLQYFLLGFLLADMHVEGELSRPKTPLWDLATLLGWPLFIFFVGNLGEPGWGRWGILGMTAVMLPLFIAAFRGTWTNKLVTLHPVTAIGGMCYTIYLIHNPMLGFTLNLTSMIDPGGSYLMRYLVQLAINSLLILAAAAVFYLLVERPCMNPKWPQDLAARLRGGSSRTALDS